MKIEAEYFLMQFLKCKWLNCPGLIGSDSSQAAHVAASKLPNICDDVPPSPPPREGQENSIEKRLAGTHFPQARQLPQTKEKSMNQRFKLISRGNMSLEID